MTGAAAPFLAGALFGFTAGVSPGPLLALVLAETLRRGRRAGLMVAMAPLITDVPIVAAALLLFSTLAGVNGVMGIVSLLGGVFVALLGFESLRAHGPAALAEGTGARPALKGALVNALNPHPYLFWLTVGAPAVYRAWQTTGPAAAASFLVGFYMMLVGSKIAVALLADRSRELLGGSAYVWLMRTLGLALLLFAVLFFIEGARLLGLGAVFDGGLIWGCFNGEQ